jgi:hypothetical protein
VDQGVGEIEPESFYVDSLAAVEATKNNVINSPHCEIAKREYLGQVVL